jgi:general stress protein YciG
LYETHSLLVLAIDIIILRRKSADDEACEEGEEGGKRSVADEATHPPKKYDEPGRRGSSAHFFFSKLIEGRIDYYCFDTHSLLDFAINIIILRRQSVDDEACEEGEEGGKRSVADEATHPPKKYDEPGRRGSSAHFFFGKLIEGCIVLLLF